MADRLGKVVDSVVKAVVGTARSFAGPQITSPAETGEMEMAGRGKFRVDTTSGSITVAACQGRRATMKYTKTCWGLSEDEARKAFEAVKVVVRRSGDTVSVGTDRPSGLTNAQRVSINYELTIPEGIDVSAESASGSVEVQGMKGEVSASSSSGSVSASDCSGGANLRSASGSANATRCEGRVQLHSQSGGVAATDCTGTLSLDSRSGSATVRGGGGEVDMDTASGGVSASAVRVTTKFRAGSASGSVNAHILPEPGAEVDVRSVSGSVRLTLPPQICANLDCRTVSGSVNVSIPCSFATKSARHVVATCGGAAGKHVRVTAGAVSGSVSVGA